MAVKRVNSGLGATALILVLTLSVSCLADFVPDYYNSNLGESDNRFPFGEDAGKEVNWLIRAGELAQPTPLPAGHTITDVYFFGSESASPAGTNTYTDLTIRMAQDTITDLTSGQFYSGPWTTVYYRASASLYWAANTWTGPITLDTPFPYDPTKSLILDVAQSGISSWEGGTFVLRQALLTGVRRVWSDGGSPFTPHAGGDGAVLDFGVDIDAGGSAVVPVPAAALLGILGLGTAGFLTRRESRRA